MLEFELARLPFSSLPRVMLTSPSIPPLTAVVYSYKVHVFVATFLRAFDSNIPPPLPVSPACASTPFCNSDISCVSRQNRRCKRARVSCHIQDVLSMTCEKARYVGNKHPQAAAIKY